ncbi:hypothetical protein GCM10007862_35000 [Dyella lipolytica]|uniref:DUF3592 domain-containing protein n=1 Tax=Dyella lipolytica TaxID=1867835 RepID=A0ABW8IXF2_9GAMM|nr:DUF3592 domain-containing protein [Dyella lipolytica]GLQ48449.1 hypothetical protein GCM10007862_35000 [Dyella lipolytica]
MSIIFPSLFSLVFVFIGVAILGYARKMDSKAKESLAWPSTDGEISHSAVLYQTNTSTDSAQTYKADIAYRYKVNGKSYSSSRISLLDLSSSTRSAQNTVDRYPDNSSVQVYYNPANPAEAVLKPGESSGLTFLYLFGGLFAVAGLLFLIASITGHVHMGTTRVR